MELKPEFEKSKQKRDEGMGGADAGTKAGREGRQTEQIGGRMFQENKKRVEDGES